MKKDLISDREIADLLKRTELKDSPEGLNNKIMDSIQKNEIRQVKTPPFISFSWILLIISLLLLILLLQYPTDFLKTIPMERLDLSGTFFTGFRFILMIFFSSAILLIAEQLIKISFGPSFAQPETLEYPGSKKT